MSLPEKNRTDHVYPTVGSELAQGLHLAELHCLDYQRYADVPIDNLPPATRVIDIWQHYRCSRCGGKRLQSRMSIHEHYRKTSQVTGLSYGLGVPGTGKISDRSALDRRAPVAKIIISTTDQYEAVMKEIEALSGAPEGSKEKNLLIDLLDAAADWTVSRVARSPATPKRGTPNRRRMLGL